MRHILIVEVEFIIAYNLTQYLTDLGYLVTTEVTEGENVINLLKQENFDLILMNIKLPGGLDGITLMNEIRTFSSIPVIYLTSVLDKMTVKRAEKTNPVGFMIKPFNYDELGKVIKQCWKSSSDKKT
ncbi:MAG: response regulator [Balneolales bacterium]